MFAKYKGGLKNNSSIQLITNTTYNYQDRNNNNHIMSRSIINGGSRGTKELG